MHPYFTTAEVAERYRTATSTVRYWRHIGYGPKGTKVGRRFLYPASAIQEFDAQLLAQAAGDGAASVYQPEASA
ncbi:helix-turn-helix domain-containing protein [Streptomyces phaeoluteigriseus]|uniref:Helix-turn-helix domain-containing protein n=1 Tax=Streptomyces phaeoluteigriseus TaxID=114686 RepID=A0ABY4Z2U4_9ACTN|nr:helix-turn-helix domain-containing protein [Streptomyces phaeoluteigriseus]USQ82662.1 helix-turn-helix domain-containing protein [Streptomyces phaeoluteigriseus]